MISKEQICHDLAVQIATRGLHDQAAVASRVARRVNEADLLSRYFVAYKGLLAAFDAMKAKAEDSEG